MAKFAATDFKVTVAGVDLSTSLTSVSIDIEADDKETTTFGSGWRTRIAGLKQGTVKLDFLQDYAAASVEATLYPLLGTITTVVVTPTSGTASTTNPQYSVTCLVTSLNPINGQVGDVPVQSVSWPTTGTVTKTP